jgi:hypothetical protein
MIYLLLNICLVLYIEKTLLLIHISRNDYDTKLSLIIYIHF